MKFVNGLMNSLMKYHVGDTFLLESVVKIAVNSRVGVGDIVRVDTISEQMIY